MTYGQSSKRRQRGYSTLGLAVSLVVFLSALDLHAPELNHFTFETPTPVLQRCDLGTATDHFEPAGGVLAPAHEPVLLKTGKRYVGSLQSKQKLTRPEALKSDVPERQGNRPQQQFSSPSPARAPPVV